MARFYQTNQSESKLVENWGRRSSFGENTRNHPKTAKTQNFKNLEHKFYAQWLVLSKKLIRIKIGRELREEKQFWWKHKKSPQNSYKTAKTQNFKNLEQKFYAQWLVLSNKPIRIEIGRELREEKQFWWKHKKSPQNSYKTAVKNHSISKWRCLARIGERRAHKSIFLKIWAGVPTPFSLFRFFSVFTKTAIKLLKLKISKI